jgi:hypothetical protein
MSGVVRYPVLATVRCLAAVIHEDGVVGQTPRTLVAKAQVRARELEIGHILPGLGAEQIAAAMMEGIRAADRAPEPMTGGARR